MTITVLTLDRAVIGSVVTPNQITFLDNNGDAVDLSSLTPTNMSGVIQDRAGSTRAIQGTLTPDATYGNIGKLAWAYHANDVSTAGQFLVQLAADFTGQTKYSAAGTWIVEGITPFDDFTFSYDLDTPTGKVRLNVADTVLNAGPFPGNFNFTDKEILSFLTTANGYVSGASIIACMTLAAHWNKFAVSEATVLGATRYDAKAVAKQWREQAEVLRVSPNEAMTAPRYGSHNVFTRDDAYAGRGSSSEYG